MFFLLFSCLYVHLVGQRRGGRILGEGFFVFGVQKEIKAIVLVHPKY
jgi:hypothetical protein